jgi:hypothetical protein
MVFSEIRFLTQLQTNYDNRKIIIITMYNEIKILQEFSKKVFDMTPITINQLLMIKKEFNNYKNK